MSKTKELYKNSITINEDTMTIEIAKGFASKAKRYGSKEYKTLQTVRKELPGYTVSIRPQQSSSKHNNKGLTLEYMEAMIKQYNPAILTEFYSKCGKDKNGNKLVKDELSDKLVDGENGNMSEKRLANYYGEIKKWYLEQFDAESNPEYAVRKRIIKNKAA